MSTINNVPLGINRLPRERNITPARKGPMPVYSSRATQALENRPNNNERRRKKDRRSQVLVVENDRRRLIQRRQTDEQVQTQAAKVSLRRGKFINLEV